MKEIAKIYTDFDDNFGIPRQPMLVPQLKGKIVFEPEFRDANCVRGLEEFTHIWLIWCFSENEDKGWSPTVRPPRLGGNRRRGVFATRAPFRPNPVGISAVKLERIEYDKQLGPVLHVTGADLMNGTPIFDIKPYIAYTDSIPEAASGFAGPVQSHTLAVHFPPASQPHADMAASDSASQPHADMAASDSASQPHTDMAASDSASQPHADMAASDSASQPHADMAASLDPAALEYAAKAGFPIEKLPALIGVLSQDPRPGYQEDPSRIYGTSFAGYDVHFRVEGNDLYIVL